ncbi:MAG: hypothetical protein HPY53_04480 [Brevinematales bacterium]|nr:hypothetical protein [Brevinematales bacterium]
MKKTVLLLAGILFFNGCALFHFFQPSAQNKILELADLKHLTLLGDPFFNTYSTLEDFSLGVDSQNIPYLALRSTNDNIVLYKYNPGSLKWDIISSNFPGTGGSSPVLDFIGDIPYVAYQDNSSWGQLFRFDAQTPTPEVSMFTYIGIDDLFDYTILNSHDQFIAFTTNVYGTNFVRMYDTSTSVWSLNPNFTDIYYTDIPSSFTLLPDQENSVYLLAGLGTGSLLTKFNPSAAPQNFYFTNSIQLLSFNIDGGNNIYYFYNVFDMEVSGTTTNEIIEAYFDIRPTSDPAISTPHTHKMLTNGMVFPGKQYSATSKIFPYYCYFFTAQKIGDMADLNVFRIDPAGNYKKMCTAYSSGFEDTAAMIPQMAIAPDGTLYVALLTVNPANTNNHILSVYKME